MFCTITSDPLPLFKVNMTFMTIHRTIHDTQNKCLKYQLAVKKIIPTFIYFSIMNALFTHLMNYSGIVCVCVCVGIQN